MFSQITNVPENLPLQSKFDENTVSGGLNRVTKDEIYVVIVPLKF